MATETMSVAEAKAHFSDLLSRVERKRRPVTILRRGKPIAQVVPLADQEQPELRGAMRGSGKVLDDIVNPYMEEWTTRGW